MKVLFAVSECVPFIKSGGLADVAGSLPKELKKQGTDVRVILPKYGTIPDVFKDAMIKKIEFTVKVGWREQYCAIEEFEYKGITFNFIDNEYYFKREKLYGYFDDGERFAFFNRAVLESLNFLDYYPDIIHCHDWHTGMIPFLLKVQYQWKAGYEFIKTVFTIHNLQFQGIFPKDAIHDLFSLDFEHFREDQLKFYDCINFMKGAIVAADKITTVSPTYRDEILTDYYGEKLHGLLQKRSRDLEGILNGIDDEVYHPEKDTIILQPFNSSDILHKKANKMFLQKLFGLPVLRNTPLVVMVTRVTKQKGMDLVKRVFHDMMEADVQFILLGTGDSEFEDFFRGMEAAYSHKCKAYIGFNEDIAHKIYAGADLFLMPSKFEPCGLGQLIAMKYGAIPLVRETGGLNDTVQSYNEITGEGNGFSFKNFNAHDMLFTYRRALSFYKDSKAWAELVKSAMDMDYSWAQSAFKYNHLYANVISRSESHVF
ncbi:glycogen synthase GlgA [Cytobacillus horneckiae]|uniref:Glycogen synthase n=1 Tax=Cytobacillus horneckiae TaxID=549687 RepID=A0A2N0ZNC0_9BACI|nr:glycogen synthase GlgA [Cytobacillus horneckiae]MCM3179443.1 glycogen synthase GlgA [Cytobacillus horneckiae]MEC1154869.1 glycogen synthase GlgA [Cytobacillus horneckiae]MED2936225.1 glycogen synthase GlgA [Cytobacillus horneckiae]PKG30987.1 glycogen synthase GlgA [Cytobacillus horneckiae]